MLVQTVMSFVATVRISFPTFLRVTISPYFTGIHSFYVSRANQYRYYVHVAFLLFISMLTYVA